MPVPRIVIAPLLALVASLAGCTDSFTVTAPYDEVWGKSTAALVANGFEMVKVSDSTKMIPASSEASGRAFFLASALPDPSGWGAPRVVQVSIEPVEPRAASERRIIVEVEKRDWVVQGNVPDPELRSRVVWILKQALGAPTALPPEEPPRH